MTAPFPGQRPLNAEVLLDRLKHQKRHSMTVRQMVDQVWNPTQQFRFLVAANLVLLVLQVLIDLEWVNARQQMNEHDQNRSSTVIQILA